jgi:hypothetical protein
LKEKEIDFSHAAIFSSSLEKEDSKRAGHYFFLVIKRVRMFLERRNQA